MRKLAIILSITVTSLCVSCGDPTRSAKVDPLGDEVGGVGPGPNHRPGQPCTACHDGRDREAPEFSIGGTLYRSLQDRTPATRATVELQDSSGDTRKLTTNCVGNFYIEKDDWEPNFPVWVRVSRGDVSAVMESPIGRDGGCATCHTTLSQNSVNFVFLSEDPLPPEEPCKD